MNADYVESIIRNIDKQSYKCILVDGAWGIGKSYMVRKALEDMKDRTCFISLFGMDDVQKIDHEAFFQLALRTSRGGKIANGAKGLAKAAGNFCEEIANLNDALAKTVSEREMLAVASSKFKKNRIIVIDDLERRKAGLDLEELFGVIEELKQSNYIKVILVANSNEIHESEKQTFDKYKEKIIDRIFEITEHSASIKWGVFGINGEFIDTFLMHHSAKNLRTLQKAQNFYNDVKQYAESIHDEMFMNEVRVICFAIVIEDTDKLYYKPLTEEETKSEFDKTVRTLQNYFQSRVKQYLHGIKSSDALINELYSYYKSKRPLTEEDLEVQHKLFVEVGIKPNFYKTDDEIAEYLKSWKEKLANAKTSYDLTMTTNELDTWWRVLNDDDSELLDTYKSMLMTVFEEEFSGEGAKRVGSYDSQYFMNINQSISESYNEVLRKARENLVDRYIEYLRRRIDDKYSEEYAGQLSIWHFERARMSDVLEGKLDEFLDRKYFPLAPMNQYKENSSYTLLAILFDARREQLLEKYEELKPTFSKMDRYRTEHYLEVIKTSHR